MHFLYSFRFRNVMITESQHYAKERRNTVCASTYFLSFAVDIKREKVGKLVSLLCFAFAT